jgi:hypothetical protein
MFVEQRRALLVCALIAGIEFPDIGVAFKNCIGCVDIIRYEWPEE